MAASVLPDIRARLGERFIFNFRVEPDLLQRHLPAWLEPQLFDGSAVASFCILDLHDVTFRPIPGPLGLRNINCAHRFGVLEKESGNPAVYVDERNTDSKLGAFITSLGFPGKHPYVDARIEKSETDWTIAVRDDAESPLFHGRVRPAAEFRSSLFASMDEFQEFLASGVRSFCPAVKASKWNVVDLHKKDSSYEPLAAEDVADRLLEHWASEGGAIEFDSAVRTAGGTYVWEYRGQTPE